MRTFAIVNRKGGVGKTTTAVNLAYVLATSCNLRVLLVDADGQANATQILLPRGEYAGLGALLRGYAICYDELTVHTDVEGLDVLPASEDLWALDLEARESCRYSALMQMRDAVEEDGTYLRIQPDHSGRLQGCRLCARVQLHPGGQRHQSGQLDRGDAV